MALRSLFAAVFAAATIVQSSIAHSTQRNPLNYATRLDDPIIQTPGRHVHAYSNFELTFLLHDGQQMIRLSLEPNHDVLHDDAHITYLNADGTTRSIEPVDRTEHKVFKGSAFIQRPGHSEWINTGWARIMIHRDGEYPIFEGSFRVGGDHHHIQRADNYYQLKHSEDPEVTSNVPRDEYMVVWRDSDIIPYYGHDDLKRDIYGRSSCDSDRLTYNAEYRPLETRDLQGVSPSTLFGRDIDNPTGNNGAGVNLVQSIGNSAGCPNTRKVALVGVATDCKYTASFNSTEAVRKNIIQQINSASEVYESTFNISLGIMNMTINEAQCPGTPTAAVPWNQDCSSSVTITDRLNMFSAWRGLSKDNNAYWTLLSTCNTGAAVGLAWLGQLCVSGSQTAAVSGGGNETIASANVVVKTPTEWQVIAHETGHTFGAVHDCIAQTCSDGTVGLQQCCPLSASTCDANSNYIMNPSTGENIKNFSPCSIGNICSAMGRNAVKSSCLTNNKDVGTITGSQCGNGIVEAGEDCDCGGSAGCGNNACCDPTTCKFKANAVCDPSNEDCCTAQCQFAAAGAVCRASTGTCDPQETCTGNSPLCPADAHQPDGTSCGDSKQGLSCASGQCTSRDLQCQTMIGAQVSNNDTYACSSQGCTLSCASPQFGPNMCVTMNQNFLDGTSCEGGGKCSNGVCQGASVANEILIWIRENKPIFIPVVGVVGGIILIALLACCWRACSRARYRRRAKAAGRGVPKPTGPSPSPPPVANMSGAWGGNSRRGGDMPMPPPPGYSAYRGSPGPGSGSGSGSSLGFNGSQQQFGGSHGGWYQQSQPNRGHSMRYA